MNSVIFLIIVLSPGKSDRVGAASVVVPFNTEVQCTYAGEHLTKQAQQRGNFILTWGCFAGGVK